MAVSRRYGGTTLLIAGALLGASLGAAAPGWGAAKVPGPGMEYEWETGTAGAVTDGDTLAVKITKSNSGYKGTQKVRTIGVQAPEVAHSGKKAQCGSAQAKAALQKLAPTGTPIQLRALAGTSYDDYSGGRIVRSIYAQDSEGNWFDTARQLVSDGTLLWFPLSDTSSRKPEWAHNLEYRVLAEDAAAAKRGLWKANLCGSSPSPTAKLRMWVAYDTGGGHERAWIANDGTAPVSIAGWTLRDSALNKYTFPAGATIPARGSVRLQFSTGTNNPAAGLYYLGRNEAWFTNLPATNNAFVGDAAYLMDSAGPYETGNLRTWFAYPCNPDSCNDPANNPLRGKVRIESIRVGPPPSHEPSKPQAVVAQSLADGTSRVTVTWKAPADLGGPVSGISYRVTARAADGTTTTHTDTGASLTRTFTGLQAGTSWTFRVTATNSQGSATSDYTGSVVPVTVPGAPRQVIVTPLASSLVVSWTPPAEDGLARITDYSVTATPAGGGAPVTVTTTGALTSAAVTGLAPGTAYSVVVRARGAGTGAASTPATATTAPSPAAPAATVPAPPAPPTGAPTSTSQVVVSWNAPADGGSALVGYVVRHAAGSSKPAGSVACLTGAAAVQGTPPVRSCLVEGLVAGAAQRFTVQAFNGVGGGAFSASSAAIAAAAYPTRPVGPTTPTPAVPVDEPWQANQEVVLTNTSSGTVTLDGHALYDKDAREGKYDSPDAILPAGTTIPAGGHLRVLTGNGTDVPGKRAFTGAANFLDGPGDRVELAGLNRALVTCSAYGGVSCAGQAPITNPTEPVGVTARTSANAVAVSWGAPVSRGGTAITGYTVTAFDSPTGGRVTGTCSTNGAGRSCSFPGAMGTRYFVQVTARNAVGDSAPSAPRMQAVPKTVPSAPQGVAVASAPGGVQVAWRPPAALNGAPVTAYVASAYAVGTGGAPAGACTASGGATSCVVRGLVPGARYFIDVVAVNRAGRGHASSPRRPANAGQSNAVTTVTSRKVTVRWDPPAPGTAVVGYAARVFSKKSGGTHLGGCTAAATATSCVTPKLKKLSTYYVELTTRTPTGAYVMQPRIVTGPAKKASAPRNVRASAKSVSAVAKARKGVVSVAWAAPSSNGYTPLRQYQARLYAKKKGGAAKASCAVAAPQLTCSMGAVSARTYYVTVRVRNDKGWSAGSKRLKIIVR